MDWIAGWQNRIKFVVDHTKINNSLYNFPVLVNLTSTQSAVFTEVGANKRRISFVNPDTLERYYCEVVYWDNSNNSAQIWVNLPEVLSTEDTVFYMLYDNSRPDDLEYIYITGEYTLQELGTYTAGELTGDATVVSDYIQLTAAATSNFGAYTIYPYSVGLANSFDLRFWHYAGGGSGADRLRFRWYTSDLEFYTVSFNEYTDVVECLFYASDGSITTLDSTAKTDIDNSTWREVRVVSYYNSNSLIIKVWMAGVLLIDVSYATVKKDYTKFAFTGYTGGATNEHRVKDITLYNKADKVWDDDLLVAYHMHQDPSLGTECITNSAYRHINATPYGTMTTTDLVNADIGKAIALDGVDDYILLNDVISLLATGIPVTCLIRFKVTGTLSANATNALLAANKATGDNRFLLGLNGDGSLYTYFQDDSENTDGTLSYGSGYGDGNWHTLLICDYGDGSKAIWADNITVSGTYSNYTTGWDTAGTFSIGQEYDPGPTTSDFFPGDVSEVYIWNNLKTANWQSAFYNSLNDTLLTKYSPETVSMGELDYRNKVKVTIPSGIIDTTLYDFPLLLHMSEDSGSSSTDLTHIFSELGGFNNRKKLVVSDYTGVSLCSTELEQWAYNSKTINLWVRVPEISSTADTVLYIYYDSTADNSIMLSDSESMLATQVWDDDFRLVSHLSGSNSSLFYDSTSNNHTGEAALVTTVDGQIGNGLAFSPYSSIVLDNPIELANSNYTMEAVFEYPLNVSVDWCTLFRGENVVGKQGHHILVQISNNELGIFDNDAEAFYGSGFLMTTLSGGMHTIASVGQGNSSTYFYIDGSYVGTVTAGTDSNIECIGNYKAGGNQGFSPVLDEVRISTTDRSAAWLKATHHANMDTLVSYTVEKTHTASNYYFHGYVKDRSVPVPRKVLLYNRASGELIDTTISDAGTGYYTLTTTTNDEHFIVVLDDEAGEEYEPLIHDKLTPNGV